MIKKSLNNFFFFSKKGREILNDINVLSKYGHFAEAANLARKTLDENSSNNIQIPKITSYERKLFSGNYMDNLEKAKKHGQDIGSVHKP